MIIVRSLATFQADFPDDCVEDDFNIVLVGGKNVTEAIRDILVAQGCTDAKLLYGGEHGWELTFAYEGYPLWMQVVQLDHYILVCKESPIPGDGSESVPHLKVLLMLNERLRQDGRFHDLVWYRQQDFLRGGSGADLPVARADPPLESAKSKEGFLKSFLSAFRTHPESDG
jgi:hypothetical protein